MNKISCDVCLDLMPLVKDNVASNDSEELVREHLNNCHACHSLYEELNTDVPMMDERKVISKIKKQLFISALVIIIVTAVLGVALSDGMGMFYNILIMPSIGVIGYFTFKKKAYLTPIALLIFSYIWLFVKYVHEGMFEEGFYLANLVLPLVWSTIYVILCTIGVLIGALLTFAFRKEVIK